MEIEKNKKDKKK